MKKDEYTVEVIKKSRAKHGVVQYLVKLSWQGIMISITHGLTLMTWSVMT